MRTLSGIFFKGLIVVLPISLTVFLLVWITKGAESLVAPYVRPLTGMNYVPGSGILVTIIFIFLIGFLGSNFVTGKIIKFFVSKFERLPIIKSIYPPLRDLISLFGGGTHEELKRVVVVEMENSSTKLVGLVTRDDFQDLPKNLFDESTIAVYIPYSYIFGGCTVFVPRSRVKEVDLPVDQALRLAITGWIKTSDNK